MKSFKVVSVILSILMLITTTMATLAQEVEYDDIMPYQDDGIIQELSNQAYFNSFSGTIKEIADVYMDDSSKLVLVENSEGLIVNFYISEKTYYLNDVKLEIGAEIIGFYDAMAPVIMIYPPQYRAVAVAAPNSVETYKADKFDSNLISADNTLKLNISDDTIIILEDGTPFEGELANRKLLVTYTVSTRSIPAQTTPSKIVVLFESIMPVTEIIKYDIIVEGNIICRTFPADENDNDVKVPLNAFSSNDDDIIMAPLRAISEELGLTVLWNGENESVTIGDDVSLTIGVNSYSNPEDSNIILESAPVIIDDTTFVPLSFFKGVLNVKEAYQYESQVIINN